ncbi:hypothetical protein BH10BAC1_BH10BAC1_11540 [soil metagenome]
MKMEVLRDGICNNEDNESISLRIRALVQVLQVASETDNLFYIESLYKEIEKIENCEVYKNSIKTVRIQVLATIEMAMIDYKAGVGL